MRPRIILPPPISAKQSIMMKAFTCQGLVEAWFACGTKFGKSLGASAGLSQLTLTMQGAHCRWVAPIYAQTKIGFKYARKIFPPPPHTRVDKGAPSLTVTGIDSLLEFKSGKFPEDLEGEGIHGYALDECAKMHRQVYDSAKTTTTVTRGPIVAFSTPRGKNWFYTKCMEAKEIMEWCFRNNKPPTHLFITAPSIDNPMVSKEAVEEARRGMPDRLFRQYYLAEFIDDGSVFVGYRACFITDPIDFEGAASQRWFAPYLDPDSTVVIGADWAKTQDYTVFTAFDLATRRLVAFERFHKTPYTEAIRKLVLFAKRFNDVLVVKHDKTGLGNVIDDQLSYTSLPYEGVTFTNAWKAEAVAQLITSIEQRLVQLPHWAEMVDEFESYEVSTNDSGSLSYAATPGKHDDIVSSLLLSHSALMQYGDSGMSVKFLEDLKKPQATTDKSNTGGKDEYVSPTEQFYNDLLNDDD